MKRKILGCILVFLCTTSCASEPVNYEHFGVWPSHDLLLAHDPKNDLSLSKTCEPDQENQGKCVLMREKVYYAMEKELLELRAEVGRIKATEAERPENLSPR